MTEAHDQDEARNDAQDVLEATLQPHRDDYAKDLWKDEEVLGDAFREAIKEIHVGSEGFISYFHLNLINKSIREYFDECAKEAIKSLDDI